MEPTQQNSNTSLPSIGLTLTDSHISFRQGKINAYIPVKQIAGFETTSLNNKLWRYVAYFCIAIVAFGLMFAFFDPSALAMSFIGGLGAVLSFFFHKRSVVRGIRITSTGGNKIEVELKKIPESDFLQFIDQLVKATK